MRGPAARVSPRGGRAWIPSRALVLNSVDQPLGCCELENGQYEITIYSCCCNADKGIYYYTSYDNHQVTAVDMHRENLDGKELIWFPLIKGEQVRWQN